MLWQGDPPCPIGRRQRARLNRIGELGRAAERPCPEGGAGVVQWEFACREATKGLPNPTSACNSRFQRGRCGLASKLRRSGHTTLGKGPDTSGEYFASYCT